VDTFLADRDAVLTLITSKPYFKELTSSNPADLLTEALIEFDPTLYFGYDNGNTAL
jgi:hypothetical protein